MMHHETALAREPEPRHQKALRLLDLARRLAASAEGLTLDEMAEQLGCGRRTAERMRDAIARLFPELEDIPDGATKRFRIPGGLGGFAQTPTREELVELGNAEAALRTAGSASRAAALGSLHRKILAAIRQAQRTRLAPDVEALARAERVAVQAGPRPFEDPEIIAQIRGAVAALKALAFTYQGGRTPGARRVVTPYGLTFGRSNYLVAAERGDDEPKNWRLDRIKDLSVLDEPAAPPDGFDLQAFADRSFGIFQDKAEDVVLRVLPAGADEARNWRFHASQELEPQADGSVLVRFRAAGMKELAWHLFTWDDQVEIVAPPVLIEVMREQLRLAAARLPAAGGEGDQA